MANRFQLCPTHFCKGVKHFVMGLRVPVVTGLVVSQDYIMHDDLVIDSSLSIVVKKIKIMQ